MGLKHLSLLKVQRMRMARYLRDHTDLPGFPLTNEESLEVEEQPSLSMVFGSLCVLGMMLLGVVLGLISFFI
jgi:hypothetical protein